MRSQPEFCRKSQKMSPAPLFDILKLFSVALASTLRHPGRHPERDWLTELTCLFVKRLFDASKGRPEGWLQQRLQWLRLPVTAFAKVDFEPATLAGVPVQWCRGKRASNSRAIVIYFHGGGYVVGSVNTYRSTLAILSLASGCPVIGVDYRLASEQPFPAAHDDCLAVSRHILQRHPQARVILAGDSAGGALAIATHLALVAEGAVPLPSGLALISPWVDPSASGGSIDANADQDILDSELMVTWRSQYLAGADPANGRVNFTREDLSQLPPTYIQAAGAEVLIDQIEAFAHRARQAGVELELDSYPGQFHVFQVLSPLVKAAGPALKRLGEFIVETGESADTG